MSEQTTDPMTDIVLQLQALSSSLDASLKTMGDALNICLNSIMVDVAAIQSEKIRQESPMHFTDSASSTR